MRRFGRIRSRLQSWLGIWAVAAALGGVWVGAAIAQRRGGEPDAEVEVRRRARLTGPQQVEEATTMVRRGEQISHRIQQLLDDARRERDIIRITCLNDRLTQVNVNLRTAQTRLRALQEAVTGGDEQLRNHQFTILTVLDQKWRTLEREANDCVGTGLYDTEGTTRVRVWVEGVPEGDPTAIVDTPIGADIPIVPPESTMM